MTLQFGPSLESLQYMQENHMNYPKLCPYWIGPCISFIITADLENVKMLSQLPGGMGQLYVSKKTTTHFRPHKLNY